MRDIVSIQALIPSLYNRLALMYYDLIKKSKFHVNVDKTDYYIAEVDLDSIERLMACDTDLTEINAFLNDFYKHIHNCNSPILTQPDILELHCIADTQMHTYWVPDQIECDNNTTTIALGFQFYATITTFAQPPDNIGIYSYTLPELIVTLLQETGGNKQFIDIESTFFLVKTLSAIYYWDNVYNNWIPVNKFTDDWVIVEITLDTVSYAQVLYTGPDRGYIKIKLVFI